MNDILLLSPIAPSAAPTPIGRLRRALARLWQHLTLDEREAYLANATDCVDLERRLRVWDQQRASSARVTLWS